MDRVYPKGGWNVRLKCDINTFVDVWMTAIANDYTYTKVAETLGCKIIDVQFAEKRLRNHGLKLPYLNINDDNDDSVVVIV